MDMHGPKCLTPEQLIKEMSVAEVQELLQALAMDASKQSASQLKQLVTSTNCLEAAIEALNRDKTRRKAA